MHVQRRSSCSAAKRSRAFRLSCHLITEHAEFPVPPVRNGQFVHISGIATRGYTAARHVQRWPGGLSFGLAAQLRKARICCSANPRTTSTSRRALSNA
jgi:hypothetical protein